MTAVMHLILRGAIVAAVLSASIGCSSEADTPRGPQTTTVAISYEDLLAKKNVSRTVILAVGDTMQISLGASPSTGYQWSSEMRITDESVLIQTGYEMISPSNGKPGAPGSAVWALQAVGPGKTTVSTTYGRPWQGGEKDEWTFTAEVTVD